MYISVHFTEIRFSRSLQRINGSVGVKFSRELNRLCLIAGLRRYCSRSCHCFQVRCLHVTMLWALCISALTFRDSVPRLELLALFGDFLGIFGKV